MWWCLGVLVTARARAFWIVCRRLITSHCDCSLRVNQTFIVQTPINIVSSASGLRRRVQIANKKGYCDLVNFIIYNTFPALCFFLEKSKPAFLPFSYFNLSYFLKLIIYFSFTEPLRYDAALMHKLVPCASLRVAL